MVANDRWRIWSGCQLVKVSWCLFLRSYDPIIGIKDKLMTYMGDENQLKRRLKMTSRLFDL